MRREGCGSLNVFFDLYFAPKEGEALGVFNPECLDRIIVETIAASGMTRRTGLLDVWDRCDSGPATSIHSLSESHVRMETWPDENHAQGEVQLCNFSRDNEPSAKQMARDIIERLDPVTAYILCIRRGPGPRPEVRLDLEWHRGQVFPF